MRALAVDIGTGTQDVLLFDSDRSIENCYRFVLPSPTMLVADAIRRATRARWAVVLTGSIMGGGPSAWAARDHAAAGLTISATLEAARSFDDDVSVVESMGVRIVDAATAVRYAKHTQTVHLRLGDLWLDALATALDAFHLDIRRLDALAIAVFDHGAAPPGVSDRRFRFERLSERIEAEPGAGPAAFAHTADEIPAAFTRLQAAASAARSWFNGSAPPILAMDTAAAAVLGALEDDRARAALCRGLPMIVVNVGNFHTLGVRLGPSAQPTSHVRIDALFEHHTGELTRDQLEAYLDALADGSISNEAVFASMGHGALTRAEGLPRARRTLVAVTGPRRAMLGGRSSRRLTLHFAVPHGDMMQCGSFGLLRGLAYRLPEWREPVETRLGLPGMPSGPSIVPAPAPWEQ